MSRVKSGAVFFFFATVTTQAIAFILTLFLSNIIASHFPSLQSSLLAVSLHALLALGLSRSFRLPGSWQVLNLLIPFLLYFSLDYELPAWIPISAAALALLTYIPTFWTRVPYYPTSRQMYDVILAELPEDKEFSFIDLGSGFGQPIAYLSKLRPKGKFLGVEIGPLPFLLSKLRFIFSSNVSISPSSLWKVDLSKYDYVYAFLAPGPMPKLWEKVQREMQRGAVFLTNTFEIESKPAKVIAVEDRRKTKLFVHRI